ncbi:MAG: hypothetical protein WBI42_04750 [Candidatus Hydrothermia bacterium]|nr:hypothetical protein [Candidatus Hydrothermia bacterium]HOL23693.1 hypothetical protein [Candidatus Hydrothermia bacterium]HPO78698.1 hypothetical protein [Candidatus Hydrothermia bacterium]
MIRKQRIELSQRHELVPLPLVIQEVSLFAMDMTELQETVLEEMVSNPMLDIDEFTDLMLLKGKFDDLSQFTDNAELKEEWYSGEEDDTRREELVTTRQSPWEKLEVQVNSYFEDTRELNIAKSIVENLDHFGYLGVSLSNLALNLGVEEEEVDRIRRIIMEFDPFGSGSADFKEFTVLQMKERGVDLDPSEVFDFLQNNIEFRKKLIPYPFFQEEEEFVRFVIPEIIFKYEEGELKLHINEKAYPRIRVSKDYLMLMERGVTDDKTLKYLKEKYRRVEKLLETMKKRKDYLRKVGELILEHQADFLTGKTSKLKPMSQSEGSRVLGIPISTFNRLLRSKYADTPRGIFSLKFFFKKPYGKGTSMSIGIDELEERLVKVINSEDKKRPYSDEEIASILRSSGIKISRRMVTKLRNKLSILDSRNRRI